MRIVFMGTPEFAAVSLRRLTAAGHAIAGVFTQPDRPSGRGRQISRSAVKELAQVLGFEVFQPVRLKGKEELECLRLLRPEIIAVVAYGQILPPEVLNLPPGGCINLHASLLPFYRGAAPIQWALLNGESKTGVTTMRMDAGLDTGDILLQSECPILPGDDMGTLHDKLAAQGADLLAETLRRHEAGSLTAQPQADGATFAPRLRRKDERLDWTEDAANIVRRIRALRPWPGAYTEFRGESIKIWEAEARALEALPGRIGGAPGEISRVTEQSLLCAAGRGWVEIGILQPAGRGRMTGADFANGRRPVPGERFV
ncbi:MAG: methionyl-tRNA formyltransferase [Gracilibacteraceae bacterium]|nr:methionyl-tRNA formyltransferase [Gracilibacteraceae bacterium]